MLKIPRPEAQGTAPLRTTLSLLRAAVVRSRMQATRFLTRRLPMQGVLSSRKGLAHRRIEDRFECESQIRRALVPTICLAHAYAQTLSLCTHKDLTQAVPRPGVARFCGRGSKSATLSEDWH